MRMRRGSGLRRNNGLAAWQQLVLIAYMEKHIAQSISVRALARFVYLSCDGFRRAFKRSFGMPPRRYLIRLRIERAKTLLAHSAWSVTAIGLALGFSLTSSFSAAFRRVTGISPTEYRQIHR
jgi:AraC family transcriptional regulator